MSGTDGARAAAMRIEHVALWTRDLDRARDFWVRWFGGTATTRYESRRRAGFASHFVTLAGGGARIELMTLPALADGAASCAVGWTHVAVQVGTEADVIELVDRMRTAGVPILSEPRRTGDGYFEAVVADPDGNEVEITA